MKKIKNNKLVKLNIILGLIFLILFALSSCDTNMKDSEVIDIIQETTFYIKEPANAKATNETQDSDELIVGRKSRTFPILPVPKEQVIEIGDKNFLTRINNIKDRINAYQDKTIIVEGMYATFSSWDTTFTGSVVYRNGPNDFDNDIWAGFFLDDTKGLDLKIDDWIVVSGTPYIYTTVDSENTEYEYLFLKVASITKSDKRKIEFVND